MTAEVIAEAQRRFDAANATHQQAVEKVQTIQQRLTDTANRMAEISERRIAGNVSQQDGNEFAALRGDQELLEKMLVEAQAAAVSADPIDAMNNLRLAQQQHDREQAAEAYEALSARLAEIEAVFVSCLAATHAAGRRIGHVSLSQSWQPSQALSRAVHYGVAPEA